MEAYNFGEKNQQLNKEAEYKKLGAVAKDLICLARDTITVRFRFFDVAFAKIKFIPHEEPTLFKLQENEFRYNSLMLIKAYKEEPHIAVRGLLHGLLHYVFLHQFEIKSLNRELWRLAADIAVEKVILELDFEAARLTKDALEKEEIEKLKRKNAVFTADKIYKEFIENPVSKEEEKRYENLFCIDSHDGWDIVEEDIFMLEEEWKKISRRIKSEIENFNKNKDLSETLSKNLTAVNKDKINYRKLLEKFMVSGEEIKLNTEEFDYIYYTYGLMNYGNIPLVEPLEYREVKKVKEFVIAIDTSASCKGELVEDFLQRTHEILKTEESFFSKINIHIIQCDSKVQIDTKIDNEAKLFDFSKNAKIQGFGATDFRPVFNYIEELRVKGEFENLKGLIYFTDGYGIYPEKMPDYDVIFVFPHEDEALHSVPGWAIKVIMEDELNEY